MHMKSTIAKAAVAAALIAAAPLALAQTASTTDTGTSTTPGTPNTGAGGDALQNMLLLGVSSAAVLGAAAYLARRKAGLA